MQCKANAQQSRNEYRLPAHYWRTAHIVDEPTTGSGRTGKSSPIFLLLATFTDLPAPANKYLNAIINKGRGQKKNRLFLEKSPELWVGGGQES